MRYRIEIATLLWIIRFIAFFLSAALDNLTTTIVIIPLARKLSDDLADRCFFCRHSFALPYPCFI